MLKSKWIKLINAIRLRKIDYSGKQVIPIKLPIPKFIDPKQMPVLKLAEGVEIADIDQRDYEQASKYLDGIRKEIQDGMSN